MKKYFMIRNLAHGMVSCMYKKHSKIINCAIKTLNNFIPTMYKINETITTGVR